MQSPGRTLVSLAGGVAGVALDTYHGVWATAMGLRAHHSAALLAIASLVPPLETLLLVVVMYRSPDPTPWPCTLSNLSIT